VGVGEQLERVGGHARNRQCGRRGSRANRAAHDFDAGIGLGGRDDLAAHPTADAGDDYAGTRAVYGHSSRAAASFFRFPSPIAQSGSLTSSAHSPSIPAAVLTGPGFVSTKSALTRLNVLAWISWARLTSPAANAAVISATGFGAMLASTEITPLPPTLMIASVSESSPERTSKSGPAPLTIALAWSVEPLASLTPTTVGISLAMRTIVSGGTLAPVRRGML